MHYISTRGQAPRLGFEVVMLAGLARDGGLYVPETWPKFSSAEIAGLAGRPFAEIAVEIISRFTGGGILTKPVLTDLAKSAYATFGHSAVTPLVQIGPNRWVLELFHGPTLAFKDVAMQLLARVMDTVLATRNERITIVGATSGDTGGAAIEAFRQSDRADCIILFPNGRVSDVQRRMMTTPTEKSVHAVAIDGTFDDCQALVKAMFNHHSFRDEVRLAGVNSINWARILAQTTYYFAATTALGRPVRFSVPTGNFGDIFAGFVARQMGLPIADLIIASNENDILPRSLETGIYEMRNVVPTTSPSMDIQISSNFERFLFEAADRDAGAVRAQMGALSQGKRFELGAAHARMRAEFLAARASEKEVAATIRATKANSGYLLEPHTACGVVALDKQASSSAPEVVLATAHPAKFPDAMQAIAGERPPLPARLKRLLTDQERFTVLPNDLAAVETFVRQKARVLTGAAV